MKCTLCGKEISANHRYCSNCGESNAFFEEIRNVQKEQTGSKYYAQQPYQYENNPYNYNQYQYQQKVAYESPAYGVFAIVFGTLGGLLGLFMGLKGLSIYKQQGNRAMCIIGIYLWGAWMVAVLIIISLSV